MNRTALVTGAARRLGKAIALALAGRGWDVCIHYNTSKEQAEGVAEACMALGPNAWTVQGDLSAADAPAQIMAAATGKAGPITALVNSASIFPADTLLDFTFESLMENMRVNAYAPLALCRRFAGQCGEGAIVNLLDSRMVSYDATHVAYHLSKKALDSITRMLAVELAPAVRVNAVAPGLVLPPVGADAGYAERGAGELPLKKQGAAKDVADATAYLLGADFVTGQTIYVDGGRHLDGAFYG